VLAAEGGEVGGGDHGRYQCDVPQNGNSSGHHSPPV
jgi:hypothetical protein